MRLAPLGVLEVVDLLEVLEVQGRARSSVAVSIWFWIAASLLEGLGPSISFIVPFLGAGNHLWRRHPNPNRD